MIKFIKPDEALPIKQLVVALYGAPGVGKSTLAQTAEKPLTLDFDRGAHRAMRRGHTAVVNSWKDVYELDAEAYNPYVTIIVDTVGAALDAMSLDLVRRNRNFRNPVGGLTLQGYGALRSTFQAWMSVLLGTGKDVVLVSHASEREDSGRMVQRLDITGSSKNLIHQAADLFGFVDVDQEQLRYVDFRPQPGHHGKDPAGFGRKLIPAERDDSLAALIKLAKIHMSTATQGEK